jgi:hypothetical protein
MKNICPSCSYKNVEEAIFCIKCGARLIEDEDQSTAKIDISDDLQDSEPIAIEHLEPPVEVYAGLHVIGIGNIFWLTDKRKFIIGRTTDGGDSPADIDLSNYNAFDQGVSRNHAAIRIKGDDIYVSDLGSLNGTSINSRKIAPFQDYRISHGDVISLGLFKLQLIITESKKT